MRNEKIPYPPSPLVTNRPVCIRPGRKPRLLVLSCNINHATSCQWPSRQRMSSSVKCSFRYSIVLVQSCSCLGSSLKYTHIKHMRHVIRKSNFCLCEKKAQISCAVTAQLISAFVSATRIVHSLLLLNPTRNWLQARLSVYPPQNSNGQKMAM